MSEWRGAAQLAVHRLGLDNGLRLLVVPMERAQTAAIALIVGVGSRHDPPDRRGLTHLLEHMLFRGTARYPGPRELNAAIESLGAPLDACVTRDQTLFELPLFPDALPEALGLLGEVLLQPRFADLEIEREVVLQERLDEVDERGRANDIDNVAMRALFPGHPLGWSIIGTRPSLRAIRVDDLRDHLARHYTGGNMILTVAGPVDPSAVRAAAEGTLGRLPAQRPARVAAAVARQDRPAVTIVSNEDSQADFDLSIVAPAAAHVDAEALELLVRLLNDGASSRIRARLCDDLGLAYAVAVHREAYEDMGLVRVTGAVAPDRVSELATEVVEILVELRRRPVAFDELERVRRRVLLDRARAFDSPDSVALWIAESALYRPGEDPEVSMGRLLGLDAADVQAVARRYLRAENAQLAVVGDVGRVRRKLMTTLAALG